MSIAAAPSRTFDVAPAWRVVLAQIRGTILGYWRLPTFVIFSMALPVIFFFFFGLPNVNYKLRNGASVGVLLMANFAAYGASSILVFNVGIGRAQVHVPLVPDDAPL